MFIWLFNPLFNKLTFERIEFHYQSQYQSIYFYIIKDIHVSNEVFISLTYFFYIKTFSGISLDCYFYKRCQIIIKVDRHYKTFSIKLSIFMSFNNNIYRIKFIQYEPPQIFVLIFIHKTSFLKKIFIHTFTYKKRSRLKV